MAGTYTSRTGKLYKPAAGDDVNVTTDINNNMDNLDTYAMGFTEVLNSAARPTTVWPGLCIYQTSDSTTWVSNGTVPASGSWIQIPNGTGSTVVNLSLAATGTDAITSKISADTTNRYVMNADGGMEWGAGGSSATDTTLRRSAANTLKTDDSFVAALNLGVGGDLDVGGGVGVLGFANANTAPTASPSDGVVVYSTGDQLTTRTPTGLIQRINGAIGLSPSPVTRSSFTADNSLATLTIPADELIVGATYRMVAWGIGATTGTPTYTFKTKIGGTAGTAMATSTVTAPSTVSNRAWMIESRFVCLATGTTGSIYAQHMYVGHLGTSGSQQSTTPGVLFDGSTPGTFDTTGSLDFVITVGCSASSASNSITCRSAIVERVQ